MTPRAVDVEMALSRPQAAATRVAEVPQDSHRFVDKRVLLTGDPDVLSTANGAWGLESALLLSLRICQDVAVCVPSELPDLRRRLEAVAQRAVFGRPVTFLARADSESPEATLRVGARPRTDSEVLVNSNGWIARVASAGRHLSSECSQDNPIAALFGSSIGVSEVFKRLLPVSTRVARPIEALEFNLFTLTAGDIDAGPPIPAALSISNAVLVGGGAIGNGLAFLMLRLPLVGEISLVDHQRYRDENLGTCLLIGPEDLGEYKATTLARHANGTLNVHPYPEKLEVFRRRLGTEIPYPTLVASAVDSVVARHEIQDLWPDMIINGAIGDFPCEVSRHPWADDVACMRCVYREVEVQAEAVQSRVTGLPVGRLGDLMRELTAEDIAMAAPERQTFLRQRVGRQLCSIVQEATAAFLTDGEHRQGFEPSVPFVATMSAAMMAGELVKHLAGFPSTLSPRFQFHALVGPHAGLLFPEGRRPDCVCHSRRRNICRVREGRSK